MDLHKSTVRANQISYLYIRGSRLGIIKVHKGRAKGRRGWVESSCLYISLLEF
jgi:hypothetical protein